MNLSFLDAAVLLAYLVGMVGFGCWFARKSTGTEEFMAAGRSLPGWVVGLSIFGTFVSSISFLANPGKSYGGNWNLFVFGLSLPVAAWITARWFVPPEHRFDLGLRAAGGTLRSLGEGLRGGVLHPHPARPDRSHPLPCRGGAEPPPTPSQW